MVNLSGFAGYTAKRKLPLGNHIITISNIDSITHNNVTGEILENGGYIKVTGKTTDGIDWDDNLLGNSKQYFLNNIKDQIDPEGPNWEGETLVTRLTEIIENKIEIKVSYATNVSSQDGKTYYNKYYYHIEEQEEQSNTEEVPEF